jgi:hypothetical protein
MKKVLFFILVLFSASAVLAQNAPKPFDLTDYGVRIEPDKRLITVMAALDFAGLETPLSPKGQEFRLKLRQDLQGVDENLRAKMKAFVTSYKSRHDQATPAQLAAPFVSLAYSLSPAPDLTEPARTTDLPDDLLEVLDFAPLVREFYRKSGFETKLPDYLKLYQAEGDKMRFSASQMVGNLLDYLHTKPILLSFEKIEKEITDPKNSKKKIKTSQIVEHERRFFLVPDLLATAGTVNFRNIGDDYYAIVPPNTNLRNSEARRAYLQFVLDPLILKNGKDISPLREGIKSLLEERTKAGVEVSPDIFLATLRSLVAAVDAKEVEFQKVQLATFSARQRIDLAKDETAKKAISAKLNSDKQIFADETALELSEAYERGAVLAFYFANQLKGLEDSGFDIESSFRDMLLTLDASKEKDRLANSAEARKRALAAREERKKQAAQLAVKSQQAFERAKVLKVKLEEVDKVIQAKDYPEADTRLNKLLDEFPGESAIYYTLGRTASLSAVGTFDEKLRNTRLDLARTHYINALKSATEETDPALIQLSYVALGRIFAFYDETNVAIQIFQTALKYGEADKTAYAEAVAALKELTKKP